MILPNKAAFIDRDGVINEERGYVHRAEDFKLLPGVVEGLALLATAGYKLVVVTNQAGVARGYYNEAAVERLHAHMGALLGAHGVHVDAVYYCPHHPNGVVSAYRRACECRKPGGDLLRKAATDLQLDLHASVMIGDKSSDISAGKSVGVALTVLVESGHAFGGDDRSQADLVALDLLDAARIITSRLYMGNPK